MMLNIPYQRELIEAVGPVGGGSDRVQTLDLAV